MDETNTFPRPRRSGRRRGGTCVAMRAPLLLSRAYSAEGGCLATPKGVPSLQPPRVFGLAISESSTASPRKFRRAFGRWAAGTIDRPPRSSRGVPPSTQCRCRSGREDAEDHVPAPALPAPPAPLPVARWRQHAASPLAPLWRRPMLWRPHRCHRESRRTAAHLRGLW